MIKLFNKIQKKATFVLRNIHGRLTAQYLTTKDMLSSQSGEGFIDTAIKILIAVVIGALLLAGLYALFGETILPMLKQRIIDMFNYGG